MNAIEIADWISEYLEEISSEPWGNTQIMMDEAQTMLRQLQAKVDKYKQVLESISNEYVELSHDKIKWQCEDHIRWAKDALK
jgi:phosphosulfolactate synthase (CoM biosynthesis protein A)